jgi:hypothetical protein
MANWAKGSPVGGVVDGFCTPNPNPATAPAGCWTDRRNSAKGSIARAAAAGGAAAPMDENGSKSISRARLLMAC